MSLDKLRAAFLDEVDEYEKYKVEVQEALRRRRREEEEDRQAEVRVEVLENSRLIEQARRRAEAEEVRRRFAWQIDTAALEVETKHAETREQFMTTYYLLYALRDKAAEGGARAITKFNEITALFGPPFTGFAYTQEERQAMPILSRDSEAMKTSVRMGVWPFRKSPIGELAEGLRQLEHEESEETMDGAAFLRLFLSI